MTSSQPFPSLTIHTSAPAKLILFGEHAVVYGKSAIATSLNIRTYATLKHRKPLFSFGNLKEESITSVFEEVKRSLALLPERKTSHCISLEILGRTFYFPFSHVLEHFISIWDHFRIYFKLKEDLALSEKPNQARVRTVDDDLVRKIEHMLDTVQLVDPEEKNSFFDLGVLGSPNKKKNPEAQTWNFHERCSLICIFYCYYVGLFHWIKQSSTSELENFDEVWIQHSEKSTTIAKEVSQMIFDLNLVTELPVGAGLGSSASFAVAIASSFMTWFKEVFSLKSSGFNNSKLEDINDMAYELECIIHGTPSGIDNTVSTYGKMILMEGKRKVVPMSWEYDPLRVIIVNTKVPRNTKDLVSSVREKYENQETHEIMEELMDSIDKLSNRFIKMIRNGFSRSKFENLIDKNQKCLNELGVGHTQLSKVIYEGKKYGLHGKLTGAGGGGCAFTYIPPDTSEDLIQNYIYDLESLGFWCKEVEISTPGVEIKVIHEKPAPAIPLNVNTTSEAKPTLVHDHSITRNEIPIPPVKWGRIMVYGSLASVCLIASSMLIRYRWKK